jgi:hypothetical protein
MHNLLCIQRGVAAKTFMFLIQSRQFGVRPRLCKYLSAKRDLCFFTGGEKQ